MSTASDLYHRLAHQGITLVAVTKNQPAERVRPLYEAGLRDFGENRVQELLIKSAQLPNDIRWHLIGHLQTNKVKSIAQFVYLVHSIDSVKLLAELDKQAARHNRVIDFLFQVHVAKEETKFGLSPTELRQIIVTNALEPFKNVRLRGLMAMGSNTVDNALVEAEFTTVKKLFKEVQQSYTEATPYAVVDVLSMGMSGDFETAVRCGSTMVRIGSLLFDS